MIFNTKQITLKNGTTAVLKTPEIADAEQMLYLIRTVSGETEFLCGTAEDWAGMTVEQEEAWVKRNRESENALVITCFIDGKAAGTAEITFPGKKKTAHTASVGITILKAYWNLGIGSALFTELIAAARERGTEIINLDFTEGNSRARYLYEKFGFKIVGVRPNMFKLPDGRYLGMYSMQKYM